MERPVGRLFLQTLAMVAEFEANIGHQHTRECMALAKKNGKLKGKQPKLPEPARRSIRRRYAEGDVSPVRSARYGPSASAWPS
jgi:DNA invertase Pin-like site-specific DNA recombinase